MNPNKRFGLIGKSLKHSFSPTYFKEKFDALLLPHTYDAIELDSIDQIGQILADRTYAGLNVTVPYKEQVIPYLDELGPIAQDVKAVNTIAMIHGGYKGYNTDVIGVVTTINTLPRKPKRALVLGTGGASKAVQYALNQLGIEFRLVSRNDGVDFRYEDVTKEVIEGHDFIVNTTPLGMFPNDDTCPDIPYHFLSKNHQLFDLTYQPVVTKFLAEGKQRGAHTTNGMTMLKTQAEAAWNIWNT